MEELPLSDELYNRIRIFMVAKKYSYNTLRTYDCTLKKIFKKYKVLDRSAINKLIKQYKFQNQRAVLLLINNYCYSEHIDFRIVIPSMVRQRKKRMIKILPLEEIDIIINSAPKPYDLSLKCIFKIGGGLRVSEMIKLSWGHFRWANWIKTREEGGVEIIDSKGDARFVTVPKKLMEELYEYAKELNGLNEFEIPLPGQIFSFSKNYKPKLRATNLERWKNQYIRHSYDWFRYNIIQKCCEPAVGHKIRVHSLRHSRATQLYDEKNIPIEIIQKLLGHKDIKNTMVYTEVTNKKMFNAMKDIE